MTKINYLILTAMILGLIVFGLTYAQPIPIQVVGQSFPETEFKRGEHVLIDISVKLCEETEACEIITEIECDEELECIVDQEARTVELSNLSLSLVPHGQFGESIYPRIERLSRLSQTSYIFLVPFDLQDGTYDLVMRGNGFEIPVWGSNQSPLIIVNSDIPQNVYCGKLNHNIKPSCAKHDVNPVEDLSFDLNHSQTQSPLLLPSEFNLSSLFLPGEETAIFVAGIQVKEVSTDSSTIDFSLVPVSGYEKHEFPGGFNDVMFVQKTEEDEYFVLNETLNIVGKPFQTENLPNTNIDELVVSFWPKLSLQDFEEVLNNAGLTSQNNVELIDFEELSAINNGSLTSMSFCNGSIAVLTIEDDDYALGQNIQNFAERLDQILKPVLKRELEGILGVEPVIVIDPQPLPGTCPAPEYLNSIGFESAQNRFANSSQNVNGQGITIAVIDTGISMNGTHYQSEFGSRLLSSQGKDYLHRDPNYSGQFLDFFFFNDFDNDGEDDVPDLLFSPGGNVEPKPQPFNLGHGTGVASVAAGNSYGVANGATILPIRACASTGLCKGSDVVKGICYALEKTDDDNDLVINLSLGGNTPMRVLESVIKDSINEGAVVVAAAGNFGDPEEDGNWSDTICRGTQFGQPCVASTDFTDTSRPLPLGPGGRLLSDIQERFFLDSQPHYPAAHNISGLIAVGATKIPSSTTESGVPRMYSHRGSYVDVVAPDERLLLDESDYIVDLTNHQFLTIFGNNIDDLQDLRNEQTPNKNKLVGDLFKGTSFSTGVISGVVAVLKQLRNDTSPVVDDARIIECLKETASSSLPQTNSFSDEFALGLGYIDLDKALNMCFQNIP